MTISTRPALAAVTGSLFILPFVAANAMVGGRIEPFFSIIRPGPHTGAREYLLLLILVLLILIGAVVAARPMLSRGNDGRRRFYPVNAVVAALLGLGFIALSVGLGLDVYRCDVLGIPNCD
jgi:hypothetical protein